MTLIMIFFLFMKNSCLFRGVCTRAVSRGGGQAVGQSLLRLLLGRVLLRRKLVEVGRLGQFVAVAAEALGL